MSWATDSRKSWIMRRWPGRRRPRGAGPGESASGLLAPGLRETRLIGGGVGHGQARSVDDAHRPALPPVVGAGLGLEALGDLTGDLAHDRLVEALSGVAVRGGVGGGLGAAGQGQPGQGFLHGFAATDIARGDLSQKQPERAHGAVAAVPSGLRGRARHVRGEQGEDIGQRGQRQAGAHGGGAGGRSGPGGSPEEKD